MDNKYNAEITLARSWRSDNGYAGKGGVVIVFNNEVAGWCNELRDPQHWIAGSCGNVQHEINELINALNDTKRQRDGYKKAIQSYQEAHAGMMAFTPD